MVTRCGIAMIGKQSLQV